MKATVRDSQTLELIDLDALSTYLTAHAWSQARTFGDLGAIYNRVEAGKKYELLVPLTRDIGDFPQRISDILKTLELVEDRSQLEILSDLTSTRADVIRIRRPDAVDGTLRLGDGATLFQSAYDMVLAAACSAATPKAYHRGKKPTQATDYIEKARLGQSERGSYVLTVISPIANRVEQPGLFGPQDPFERQVTRLISNGLHATVEASEYALSKADTAHFRDAKDSGVSANLLDAVIGLMGIQHNTVGVNFAWSPEMPVSEELHRTITIESDYFGVIEAASKELKAQEPLPPVELVGVVEGLRRPQAMSVGHITLSTFIEGMARKVQIDLDAEIYDRAIIAHRTKRPVSCAGELVRLGRTIILKNVRSFVVAPEFFIEEGSVGPLFHDN